MAFIHGHEPIRTALNAMRVCTDHKAEVRVFRACQVQASRRLIRLDFVVDPAYAVLCHPSFPMLRFCSDNSVLSFARVACFADAIKSRRVSGVISKLSVVTSGGMGNAITFRLRAAHVGAPGPAT